MKCFSQCLLVHAATIVSHGDLALECGKEFCDNFHFSTIVDVADELSCVFDEETKSVYQRLRHSLDRQFLLWKQQLHGIMSRTLFLRRLAISLIAVTTRNDINPAS